MSCRIEDTRHFQEHRRRPSVPGMRYETCESTGRWGRFYAIAGPLFGAAWLWSPVAAWATSDPQGWEIPLVAAGIPVFAAMFLYTVMTRRPVLPPVLTMLAIAVALTLGVYDAFAWLFVWAGSAASVRLSGLTSAKAVAAITALAAATLALT